MVLLLLRIRPRLIGSFPCETFHCHRPYSLSPSKSTDRLYRQAYNRSVSGSGSGSTVSFKPTLRDLLTYADLQGKSCIISTQMKSSSIPSPLKPNNVIDLTLFHIILSFTSPSLQWHSQHFSCKAHNLLMLTLRLGLSPVSQKLQSHSSMIAEISSVASHYNLSLPDSEHPHVHKALLCASHQSQYDISNIPQWILSVLAPSVSQSCDALTGLSRIPPCIISDLLFRSPVNASELYLMRDLFLESLPRLALAHINNARDLETIFTNLIFYSIRFDPHSLPDLVSKTFQYMHSPKKGFTIVDSFDSRYINTCIWEICVTALLRTECDNVALAAATTAQETLVLCFPLRRNESPRDLLSLCAYLGIASLVYQSSSEKAIQLLELAEKRFLFGASTLKKVDSLAYSVAKLLTMPTPQDSVHQFNKSANPHSNSPVFWLAFIHKLRHFGLLNQDRALSILAQVVKHQLTLLISKDIILALVRPIRGLKRLDKFIHTLGPKLTASFAPILISKQMQLLYRHRGNLSIPETAYPWDRPQSSRKTMEYKGHASILEYGRFLSRSLPKTNPLNLGAILQGEAMVDPRGAFQLYVSEFATGPMPKIPDERCLMALLQIAITDKTLCHEGKVSPQIAVHEFKTSVKKTWDESTGLIMPSKRLWQQYIYLLHKYEYIPELAILIEWWQNIHFVPDKATLAMLLASLPPEFSARYLVHYAQARPTKEVEKCTATPQYNSTLWDWPDKASLEQYVASDSRFQHKL